ncbi:type II secretion system F family protein [Noviherbaspirillum galbum]|uniref:Type II secretion system protein GspF domain-containing protein n=1 Tax=Noviherbaspirillum galbum TaxID=2709383 RepID=A0A6B3STB8_9BURK|nr:hypothetical protein [Noviherbaspirillum galbum]NEX64220.1 hypothetical protein [Noviherbaspirillum galbum]
MTAVLEKINFFLGKMSFRSSMDMFYEELLENLRMNISLSHFLATRQEIAERRGDQGLAMVYGMIMRRMQEGGTLSDAIVGLVPDSNIMMIRAGEHVAKIIEGVESATFANKSMQKMRAIVVGHMVAPFALAVMLFGMLVMFGVMVIPQFLFVVKLDKMGYAYQVTYAMTEFVKAYWFVVVPVLLGLVGLLVWSVKFVTGAAREWLDKVPPYSVVRQYTSAGLLIKISGLLRNNVTLEDAVGLMRRDAGQYERHHLELMKYKLNNGQSLTTALDTGLVPHEVVDRLVSFERAGSSNLEEIIKRIGFENIDKSLRIVDQSVGKIAWSIKIVVFLLLLLMVFDTFTLGNTISAAVRSTGR